MLDNQVIIDIRRDLNQYGGHDLLDIPGNEVEEFWNWFLSNAAVILNSAQQPANANNRYHQGRCLGNAQSFALEFTQAYFEGFVIVEGSRYIHHGFIVHNNQVTDPTALTHPDGFVDQHGRQPAYYYGIEIPLAFYEDQADIVNNTYSQSSFLYSHFSSIT